MLSSSSSSSSSSSGIDELSDRFRTQQHRLHLSMRTTAPCRSHFRDEAQGIPPLIKGNWQHNIFFLIVVVYGHRRRSAAISIGIDASVIISTWPTRCELCSWFQQSSMRKIRHRRWSSLTPILPSVTCTRRYEAPRHHSNLRPRHDLHNFPTHHHLHNTLAQLPSARNRSLKLLSLSLSRNSHEINLVLTFPTSTQDFSLVFHAFHLGSSQYTVLSTVTSSHQALPAIALSLSLSCWILNNSFSVSCWLLSNSFSFCCWILSNSFSVSCWILSNSSLSLAGFSAKRGVG